MPSPLDEPEQPTPSPNPIATDDTKQPLAIADAPFPDERPGEVRTLDLGQGGIVKLDELGPMIINSDGVRGRRASPGSNLNRLDSHSVTQSERRAWGHERGCALMVDLVPDSELERPPSDRTGADGATPRQEAECRATQEARC